MNFLFVFSIEPWFLPPALEFIKVLRKKGYQVDLIYRKSLNKGEYDLQSLGIEPVIVKQGNRISEIVLFNLSIRKILVKREIHFVVFADLWSLQSMIWISRKKYRSTIFWNFELIRKVTSTRFSFSNFKGIWYRYLAGKMDYIFVPSKDRVDNFVSWLAKNKKIFVVLNARSREKIIPSGKNKGIVHVLHAGSLSNIHLADKVYRSILHLPENYIIHIAGIARGNYEEELLDFIEKHDFKGRLVYYGLMNKTELDKLLEKSHIGVVLYNKGKGITGSNIAPTKLGDYISGGLKVVGSDQDYLKYWLDERKLGKTISEITEENIAAAILEIAESGKQGGWNDVKSIFIEEYNMDIQVNKVLQELKLKE